MRLYSILDKKAGEFGPPLDSVNDAVMCRQILESIRDDHLVRKYPTDFDLFYVGEFSSATGFLVDLAAPVFVVNLGVVFSDQREG